MSRVEMKEMIDGDLVKKAGAKVLELAEKEGWSGAMLYIVLRELAEFFEQQGLVVQYEGEDYYCN